MPRSLLPPAVWCHGAQSTISGGSSCIQESTWLTICWFEHHMRCVLITAFGLPVEPEVKRNLAMVSDPALATPAPSASRDERLPKSTSAFRGAAAFTALAKAASSEAYTSPGVTSSITCLSWAKSVETSEYAGDTGAQ